MEAFRIPNLSLLKSTVELFRLSSKNHAERAIFILSLFNIFAYDEKRIRNTTEGIVENLFIKKIIFKWCFFLQFDVT